MNSYKKLVVPLIYMGAVAIMMILAFLVLRAVSNYVNDNTDYKYTLDDVFDNTVKVNVVSDTNVVKPYVADNVSIGKNFYDMTDSESEQELSIILYENTYMQNSGVDYVSDNSFDVVSIYDGEVVSIEESSVYGKVITIKHDNNLVSVYSSVSNIVVSEGYNVTKGEIIASSNKLSINDYGSTLHFEVYHNNNLVNPEEIYGISIEDF